MKQIMAWFAARAADYELRGPVVLAELADRSAIEFLLFVLYATSAGLLVPSLPAPAARRELAPNLLVDEKILEELAQVSPLEYDRHRSEAARRLGVRRETLDDAVEARREQQIVDHGPSPMAPHWRVTPWPEPVDGGVLISEIINHIKRYVVLSNDAAIAVALWVVMTWCHEDAAQHSPILMITSVERDSGKTTLNDVIKYLVLREVSGVELTKAVIYRVIDKHQPTILVDEADALLANDDSLRAVINSGWVRGSGVWLWDRGEERFFSSFAPKVLILKGRRLPDTTLSRSIIIEMKRKLPSESVQRFRQRDDDKAKVLRQKCLRFASEHSEALFEMLEGAGPAMPDGFSNRLAANWEILFAISDFVGGEWPGKTREAAERLSDVASSETSIGVQLLTDIRTAFRSDDRLATKVLIERLTSDPERPWQEFCRGKSITDTQLAKLLKPYGIKSMTVRLGRGTPKGYTRAAFKDAWKRYCP